MEFRNVGSSGLRVSQVGLGCNNFGGRLGLEETRDVVFSALDNGINFFNTADTYGNRGGSETLLGEVLGERRKDIVLLTKFGKPMDDSGEKEGGSRRYIMSAVEASLKRLKTDWIDLYVMHAPDPRTPIEETMRALEDLVAQGKVLYIGCSNFAAWQLAQAVGWAEGKGTTPFICAEDEYSLLVRRNEETLFPAVKALGMSVLPFYPLASGLLTGKYRLGQPNPEGARLSGASFQTKTFMREENLQNVEKLTRYAEERGHSLLDLAMSWLAGSPLVPSIIAGATKPSQIEGNVKAAFAWKLTEAERGEIDALLGKAG